MDLPMLDAHKRSILIDVKKEAGKRALHQLCSVADVLIDPYRPGVLERLKLGPSDLMSVNPRLIYARISGFGQTGPLANRAGHDINYVALSGVLSMLGRKETVPTPPINLLADFAGGGLLCALGIALALFDRTKTGKGQIVDNAMSEGAAYVGSFLYSSKDTYIWGNPRGCNWLDSGAHFYDTYETKDGRHMAVGAIEPQFYENLLKGLNMTAEELPHMFDFDENRTKMQKKFKERTMAEWTEMFENVDACVTPVLTMAEAPHHPHNKSRGAFTKVKGSFEPRSAPVLLDVDGNISHAVEQRSSDQPPCPTPGEHTAEILKEIGYSDEDIEEVILECGRPKAKL